MRPRINPNFVCKANASTGKCFYNKHNKRDVQPKTPHVRCFGELVPISVSQALTLVHTQEIIMK